MDKCWENYITTRPVDSKGEFDAFKQMNKDPGSTIHGPRNMADGGRIGLFGGGFLKLLYKGKSGLQLGKVQKDLINKYRNEGMSFIDAITKGNKEGFEIVNQKKLKIVKDKMSEVNIQSDEYVDLIDEHIKLTDSEFYKDIKRWDQTRPALADKSRAQFFPDWAEARYGEDYHTVLERGQTREIRESIDPNIKEPLSPADQMVSDIDDMNKANIDEIFEGRKKNAYGGRIGYDDGQLVRNTADGSRPGYEGKSTLEKIKSGDLDFIGMDSRARRKGQIRVMVPGTPERTFWEANDAMKYFKGALEKSPVLKEREFFKKNYRK